MKALPNISLSYSGTLKANQQFNKTTEVRYSSSNKFPHFPDSTSHNTDEIRDDVKASAKYICYTGDNNVDTITNYLKRNNDKESLSDYIKKLSQTNTPSYCGFAFNIKDFKNIKSDSTTVSLKTNTYNWLAMKCGEGITPAYSDDSIKGQSYKINGIQINWNDRKVIMKILYVKANSYAVIGFLGPKGGNQASYAIYKIPIRSESGKIGIYKIDNDTKKPLSGAVYKLYTDKKCKKQATDVNDKAVAFKTGEDGKSNSVTIDPGTYYLKETTAPTGYELSDKPIEWKVSSSTSIVYKKVSDESVPFSISLKLTKQIDKTNVLSNLNKNVFQEIDGAVYQLRKGSSSENVNEKEADAWKKSEVEDEFEVEDGIINTGELEGSSSAYQYYFIKESDATDGYELDPTIWSIYLRRNTSQDVPVVTFRKSTDGGKTFHTLKDTNGNLMEKLELKAKKNTSGKVVSYHSSYSVSNSSHFYSKEKPKTFNLTFKKEDNNKKALSGVKFTLYHCDIPIDTPKPKGQNAFYDNTTQYENNKVKVTTVATDSNGKISIKNLPINTTYDAYYLTETLPTGYTKDYVFYYLHVWESGDDIVYTVEKIKNKADFDSSKEITEDNRPYQMAASLASKATLPNNKTIDLSSTPVINYPEQFSLKFKKTDNTGKALSGVTFDLYHCDIDNAKTPEPKGQNAFYDTTQYTNNKKLIKSATSDANGVVNITNLEINKSLDTYYLVEKTVPSGYTKDFAFYYLHVWYSNDKLIYTLSKVGNQTSFDSSKLVSETNRPYIMKEALASQASVPSNKIIDFTSKPIINTSTQFNVTLEKRSANEALTSGNSCYSLAGATYTLYKGTKESSTEHLEDIYKKKVKVSDAKTVLNTNGRAYVTFNNLPKLPTNQFYFIEETAASKSFAKDNRVFAIYAKDGTASDLTYTVWYSDNPTQGWYTGLENQTLANKGMISLDKLNANNQRLYSLETPLNDPFRLQLQKLDQDTGKPIAQGTASLEGAVFEIKYFDNTDEKVDGTAKKTWYFKTDKNGKFNSQNKTLLVNNAQYKSDELFINEKNDVIYPLGSYQIKEVQAPEKYQLSGTMKFNDKDTTVNVEKGLTLVIAEDENGNIYYKNGGVPIKVENVAVNVYEKVYKGDVQIIKLDDDDKTPLEGVEFKLVGDDGSTFTGTTNKEGKLSFTELIPQHYVLTETKTVAGHQLLKDNIDITVPLEMTTDEAKKQKVDTSKAVFDDNTQTWCFYSQTCQISNDVQFMMPMTGGNSIPYIPMVLALILIGGGVLAIRTRKQ